MSTHFISIDRNQSLLLPPDLRDWVADDDMVHFVIEAVESMELTSFKVNHRGTGSAQYPPRMMLSLLIYCYANGIFSSRRIERATHRDISVRFLTADTHPDHDTIAKFRRENFEAVSACFLHVLMLARELKLLKVGTVSVDGTTLKANASINRNVRHDRACALIEQLELEIKELMEKAESSDQRDDVDGQSIPKELARLETLKEKLDIARKNIEARNKKKQDKEQAKYESQVKAREQRHEPKGRKPKPPDPDSVKKTQSNLTDPDSRVMRHNKRSAYEQAYNGQAVVDADGSQLVLGTRVAQICIDKNELVPDIHSIPQELGTPKTILADNGYLNQKQVRQLEADIPGVNVLVSAHAEAKQLRRKHDFRPTPDKEKDPPKTSIPFVREMRDKMQQPDNKEIYKLRKQTVEPVFGTIKKWMGFTQFNLRGHQKVSGEWELVTLAYNFKRLWNLKQAQETPIPSG